MIQPYLQIGLIYFIGMLQGIVMVMVPAAGALLTNGHYHDLSPSEYGALFVPMIFGAVGASLAAGNMASYKGLKRVFLWGMFFNLLSMSLFALTNLFMKEHLLDYSLLLICLLFLGLGFGSTLTMLNTYVVIFFSKQAASGMTAMHALLGTGTALAPLLLNLFMTLHMWWGAPLLVAFSFFLTSIFVILIVTEETIERSGVSGSSYHLPPVFWLFAFFTLLYGLCETVFGNWATIYLTSEKNISIKDAGIALSFFWAMVTFGRISVSVLSLLLPARRFFITLPLLIAVAFVLVPEASGVFLNIAIFAFAGLACSACFPLSISFGESQFRREASFVSGRMTAAYMVGYGIAAYGVGVIHEWFLINLEIVYFFAAIPALIAWAITLYFWQRRMLE